MKTLLFSTALLIVAGLPFAVLADTPEAAIDPGTTIDWNDPAFDQYLNVYSLGHALGRGDSESLLNMALQLREGERVLLRTHKSGISSKALIGKALRAARENVDTQTIDRLKQFSRSTGDDSLLGEIEQAAKLTSASRNTGISLSVPLDALPPKKAASLIALSNGIRGAALSGDRAYLDSAEQQLADLELEPPQETLLRDRIRQTREQIPESPQAADAAFSKLAGFSRGWLQQATGQETPSGIQKFDPTGPIWREQHDSGYTGSWAIEGGSSPPPQRPTIDSNGNVWAGSPRSGTKGNFAGKAQLAYNANGQAFWQSSYQDRYGTPSAIPAPTYNKNFNALKSYQPGQQMSSQQARQLLEWHELSRQGKTRPTLYGDIHRP